jgi:hypothetical protein
MMLIFPPDSDYRVLTAKNRYVSTLCIFYQSIFYDQHCLLYVLALAIHHVILGDQLEDKLPDLMNYLPLQL